MPAAFNKHKIAVTQITNYLFAYNDSERRNGYFADLHQDLRDAKSHIVINGWAVEDIPLGVKSTDSEIDDRPMLSTILFNKSMEVHNGKQPLILIQSWNHELDGGKSNDFGKALKQAAKEYYKQHGIAEIQKLEHLKETANSREAKQSIEKRIALIKKCKRGKLPPNLIWRANSGRKGALTNSNHQKSVCIDGQIAYTGGIDLAEGRDVLPGDEITEGIPIFRDGQTRTVNPPAVQDIEDSAFSLALSKTRHFKTKFGPKHQSHANNLIYTFLSRRLNDIYRARKYLNHHTEAAVSNPDNPATWQLLRTIPKGQIMTASIHDNPVISDEVKASLRGKSSGEKSIKEQYIQSITEAESYIYIENQNFTTESMNKPNTVPRALLDRIIRADQNGEDFHLFITLPRYPVLETDDPDNMQVKFLASAQQDTIEQFLDLLRKNGVSNPTKYLTISTQVKFDHNGKQAQVYNHSKLMFTDKTCIQGSSNISDRSMEGNRDSEHAVQVNFNGDKDIKGKYDDYLLRLVSSNMGQEFLQGIICINESYFIKEGIIPRPGATISELNIGKFLADPKVQNYWQLYLTENQKVIDNNNLKTVNIDSEIPIPHDYYRSALLKAQKQSNESSKSLSRKPLIFKDEPHAKDKPKPLKESPKTSKAVRKIVKKITNLHR